MKRFFLALIFILSWSICLAEMPHILKNGDIVDANQLNENFNQLETKINENFNQLETKINESNIYTIRADGNIIGTTTFVLYPEVVYVKKDLAADNVFLKFHNDFYEIPLTKNGHILNVYSKEYDPDPSWPGSTERFYFKQDNCQGDKYIFYDYDRSRSSQFIFSPIKGKVYTGYSAGDSNSLYYYKKGASVVKLKGGYSYFIKEGMDWVCKNSDGDSNFLIKILPNNPIETGIQTYPFPLPITFDGLEEATVDIY